MLTLIHVLCDCNTNIFCGLNVFQSLLKQSVLMNDLFVWVLPRHSLRVTFGNIELHLPFGLPEPKTVKIFLQNETVLQGMNVPIQDIIVREQANWRLDIIGRSFMKITKRISPKTDARGTQDKTETGSEAWPSKTTCWLRLESHELIHLWVDPLIP